MNGHEITYALKCAGRKVKDIAHEQRVSSSFVTQVIYKIRQTQRIRVAIAAAIGQPVDVVFPPDQPKEEA
jgi:lambda repressor-like predicted transcriptional regulator